MTESQLRRSLYKYPRASLQCWPGYFHIIKMWGSQNPSLRKEKTAVKVRYSFQGEDQQPSWMWGPSLETWTRNWRQRQLSMGPNGRKVFNVIVFVNFNEGILQGVRGSGKVMPAGAVSGSCCPQDWRMFNDKRLVRRGLRSSCRVSMEELAGLWKLEKKISISQSHSSSTLWFPWNWTRSETVGVPGHTGAIGG